MNALGNTLYLSCLGMESFCCALKIIGYGNLTFGVTSLDLCKKPRDGPGEMEELRNKPLKQKLAGFSVGRRRCPYLSKLYGCDFFVCTGDYDIPSSTVNWVLHYVFRFIFAVCPKTSGKGRTWVDRDEFMATLVGKMGYGVCNVMSRWDMQRTNEVQGILNYCTSGYGAMWLQKAPQGGFMIDMSPCECFEMRGGFLPYGGTLHIAEDLRSLDQLVTVVLQGKEYKMGDPEFDGALFVLRSSVFTLAIAGDHTMYCHMFVSNLVTMAARTTLKPSHPLRVFLNPFTVFSAVINDFAEYAIIDPAAIVGRLAGLSDRGHAEMIKHYTKQFRWCETFPAELRRKGLDNKGKGFGEDFIYGTEGLLLWGIFERFARDYVSLCWHDDAAVAGDTGVAAFFAELSTLFPQNTGCVAPPPKVVHLRTQLECFLAFVMWNVTAVHEHTGFVGDLLMEYDFANSCLRKGDLREKQTLMSSVADSLGMLFTHAITSAPTLKLMDAGLEAFFPEGPIRQLVGRFREELQNLHEGVVARNKNRADAGRQPCWTFDPALLEISVSV